MTTMIAFLNQSGANMTMRWSPSLATTSTLTNGCSIDCNSACLISACIRASKSIEGLNSIDCTARCVVVVVG